MFTGRAGTEPQQSRPRLRSQALADKWIGFEMMAPMVYSQEGPHTRQIWVQICLGRRKLYSGELRHLFYNVAPSSSLGSHYASSLWQTKPLLTFRLTKSPTPFKIRRLLPQWERAKSVKAAAQDTRDVPGFILGCSFFLSMSCHSRGNQCSFIKHPWHKIDPLKVVAFLEKHKCIAELTTPSTVQYMAFRKTKNWP